MLLCLVFLMLSRMFIAALWLSAGTGLISWLLFVMFVVFLLLSHVVSLVLVYTIIIQFHRLPDTQLRVIAKVYDFLGQPSYSQKKM